MNFPWSVTTRYINSYAGANYFSMKMSQQQRRRMYSHHDRDVDVDEDFWPMIGVLGTFWFIWTALIHFLDWLSFDVVPLWAEPLTVIPFVVCLILFQVFDSANPLHWWPLMWGYKVRLPDDYLVNVYNTEDRIIEKHGGKINVCVLDHEYIKFRRKKDAVIFGLRYF